MSHVRLPRSRAAVMAAASLLVLGGAVAASAALERDALGDLATG
ncbi:hypothetical protein ACFY4I_22185 [Streptomyces scabiei]